MEKDWAYKSIDDIFLEFDSSENGLTENEAILRLKEFGENKLPEPKIDGYFVIFLRQFKSPLIYILFVASILVLLMDEFIDAVVIFLVLFFNAIIGTVQEGKARNTLLALKKFSETTATVKRGGKTFIIPDKQLVPGDVIIIQEGEKIPADARIILSNNIRVNESNLTGESTPISKIVDVLKNTNTQSLDKKNMVFKGSNVVGGNGLAIVVATGTNTIIGKISEKISVISSETPLAKNIKNLSRLIIYVVLIISVILYFLGIFLGKPAIEMFTTVVSLVVSVIPEGLPVVLTLVLSTGVWRMSKKNALVKNLQAVESLGQAKIIAVDKTGTITKNELVVQRVFINNNFFDIEGLGYEPRGEIILNGKKIDPLNYQDIIFGGLISILNSGAKLIYLEDQKTWSVVGDPTEGALKVFAQKVGFSEDSINNEYFKTLEEPFDYNKKYRIVSYKTNKKNIATIFGAPESILNLCNSIWTKNGKMKLSKDKKQELDLIFQEMSANGLRVVAGAVKETTKKNDFSDKVDSLTFVGFFGMKDALRPEVKDATEKANSAGIKVIMITGDHKITAQAIAKEAGILKENDIVLTGQEIDLLTQEELSKKLSGVSVFARVNPEHKLKIINVYKLKGDIIAMTGDGVNDAMSLVSADLGVAMGRVGTEVAKEASDIVLLDDDFGNIVYAIEEGRSIYKTIKKVILYLFSTSLGEIFAIFGSVLMGFPLIILPSQIIWLNFVTDGFLTVALPMEPKEEGLLKQKNNKSKYIIDNLMTKRMFLMALPMAIGSIFVFSLYFKEDIIKAYTMSLTTLAIFQWFNILNCGSEEKSIFKISIFSNKLLLVAIFIVIALQILLVYNPFMQKIFQTTAISLYDWVLAIIISSSIIVVEEIRKLFFKSK